MLDIRHKIFPPFKAWASEAGSLDTSINFLSISQAPELCKHYQQAQPDISGYYIIISNVTQ